MRYESRLGEASARYEAEKSQKELEIVSLKLRNNRVVIFSLIGLSVILIVGALLFVQRNRYRANQRIEAMNHKISELNQQNLRQQMNPHFIFNTLNSIQYYVFQQDKIAANDYMSKFATLMRKTLENSRQTAIPINDELDALKLYLELESLRFKQRFEWNIEVDEEVDTLIYKMPTMLIQPYVENAISHGLMQKEGKGYVHIALHHVNGSLMCTVEDNGIGRARAAELKKHRKGRHNSLGTTITESRLKLVNELYGNKMQVNYVDKVDINGNASGTRVEITIPIIT
jgi:LytS/YehU family sensor histidine kinase